jgi:predicted small lipoprotein YifL
MDTLKTVSWLGLILILTPLVSCGVKGPPLPPVPTSAETSDSGRPEPRNSPSPAP